MYFLVYFAFCLAGVYGRVVDIESGKILGPNEVGEVQFKGNLMKGYVSNKQATSATIDTEGWLHTGDTGYYDQNNEWYIVDRIKELIKYKGYQVPPAEIEALLLTHDQIKDAAVIGIPNDKCGEIPFAFVVRQPNATIVEKDVIKYVAGMFLHRFKNGFLTNATYFPLLFIFFIERISKPKQLHGGLRFLDEIPKNPSGKILRRVLREMVKKHPSKL